MKIKKALGKIVALICCLCLILGMSSIVCMAAGTSTMACSAFNVGDTVSVTVNIKADAADNEIWAVEGSLSYNSSVLTFVECNETANLSGSEIKFSTVGNGSSSKSVTFTFTAIAVGVSYTKLDSCKYSGGVNNSVYDVSPCGINIIVKESEVPPPQETSQKGDTNADGVVNILDLVHLKDTLSVHRAENEDISDLNGDGYIDAIDLSELKKILLSL